ncbi:MAG: bifunctional DNA primase/polymerase [Ilumatobacteraceae bacterium]
MTHDGLDLDLIDPFGMPVPTGFAAVAREYAANNWHPFPLAAGTKSPPPDGVTGANGVDATPAQIDEWVDTRNGANIGLRMALTVIGIDVDQYDAKRGADTLADLEARFGPLPPTMKSSSRGDGPSGIRFLTVPAGVMFPGVLGEGIEVVQHHHRYAVVYPSTHPKTGATYKWWTPMMVETSTIPRVVELAALPTAWIEGLRVRPVEVATKLTRLPAVSFDDGSIAQRIRDDHEWHQLLPADGWQLVTSNGTESKWTRPGKDIRQGTSAVLHEPDGPFNVFTSSMPDLQAAWALTKDGSAWTFSIFGYLAATQHGGDRKALAREYRKAITALDVTTGTTTTTATTPVVPAGASDATAGMSVPVDPAAHHHHEDDEAVAVAFDGYRLTEAGNALRLVELGAGRLRYVHAWGRWIVYRHGRWGVDAGDALVTELAKKVARRLLVRVAKMEASDDRDAQRDVRCHRRDGPARTRG